MNRRDFIRRTSLASVGGYVLTACNDSMLGPLLSLSPQEDRVLVIVQLYGGNDGLNTVVPLDQYSLLTQFRSNILLPVNSVLPLQGTNGLTGFHPAMTGLRSLWDDGKLNIIQGVGYPNPNFSHFRSTDIWETASNANDVLSSGWIGRYLSLEYPNYPVGFPNTDMPDPLAIRVGGPVGIGMQNLGVAMGTAINNTSDPLDLAGNIFLDPAPTNCAGDRLNMIRLVQRQTDQYGDVIEAAANMNCQQSSLYPTGSAPGAQLGQALKIVAQLICGGLKTKVYWVSDTGFDTHAQQTTLLDTTVGKHADLLQGVSDAIHAFQNDLQGLGLSDRVLGMTFSEFGRRVKSNGSRGTDHGAAAPMFFFGDHVLPGIVGANPAIDPNTDSETNVDMQHDFRTVYASVLKDWFCLPQWAIDDTLLGTYSTLPIVDPAGCVAMGLSEDNQTAGVQLLNIYPSPFQQETAVEFTTLKSGNVRLEMFDAAGSMVQLLVNQTLAPGTYKATANLAGMRSGMYSCRLENEGDMQVRNVMKVN
ncbi:MAG: DUF1501 domain-containing protein [Flavobacteriales bacterium]